MRKHWAGLISLSKENFPIILVFFLQIPLILPFFHKGFFPSHDDVQVTRIFEMFQSFSFGDIPPRWSANLLFGYGYPLYIFYSPFPYFIGVFFNFLGLNFLLSTKTVFIFSFLIGGVGMYLLVKKFFGRLPSLVSAVAFSFSPYRALDVYVRGNLAEFFAISIFPIVFLVNWNLVSSLERKKTKAILLLAFFFFLLEISHNLSCFIYFIFMFIFDLAYLFLAKKEKFFFEAINLFKALVLSLLLSAFYILPLLIENRFVQVSRFLEAPYQNYFLTLAKIWHTPWGWNGFIEKAPMSLQLGKILIIFSSICFILNQIVKSKFRFVINIISGLLVWFTFLEIKQSIFVWKTFPYLAYLQFPWRFHIVTTFLASILTGGVLYLCAQKFGQKLNPALMWLIAAIPIFLVIAENANFFKPRFYWSTPYVSETTTWNDEYLPKWVKVKPKDYSADKVMILEGWGAVNNLKWGYLEKNFSLDMEKEGRARISHVYYPGWTVYINGIKANITYDNPMGLMTILASKGKNEIKFVFQRTWWRTLADFISIAGFLVFTVLIAKLFFFKGKNV